MLVVVVNDVVVWVFLVLVVVLLGFGRSLVIVVWVLLCGIVFCLVIFFVV